MCLHPKTSSLSFPDFDYSTGPIDHDIINCNYVDSIINKEDNVLRILQLNIRGIVSKQSDLRILLLEQQIDICLICETWLTSTNENKLDIAGYNYVGKLRSNRKGGGVCVLVKENIVSREIPYIDIADLEYCAVEIKGDNGTLVVCSAYRPPNSNTKEFLKNYDSLIKRLQKIKSKGIVIGLDHNLDLLKHSNHSQTQDFLNLNLEESLLPTINKPTRLTKSSATLIDNLFVSHTLDCVETYILYEDISDHLPCVIDLSNLIVTRTEDKMMWKQLFDKYSIDVLKSKLTKVNWDEKLQQLDVSKSFKILHDEFQHLIQLVLPSKLIHNKKRKTEPWLTKGILQSIKKQKCLYAKWAKNKTCDLAYERYTSYRNVLKRLRRYSKKKFYADKCEAYKSNTKQLWKLINKCSGKISDKSSLIDYLTIGGIKQSESDIIADEFAKFFFSIGKEYSNKIKPSASTAEHYLNKIKGCPKTLFMYPTTQNEIENLISNMTPKNSSGHDGISNKVLKELGPKLSYPLQIVFNRSLESGDFPDIMKLAVVIPLYKNKNRDSCTNYRPISLLLTTSKVLEKIVYKRTYQFLVDNNLLYDSQYGFRSKHSCENAITELTGAILKGAEQKKTLLICFLGFE